MPSRHRRVLPPEQRKLRKEIMALHGRKRSAAESKHLRWLLACLKDYHDKGPARQRWPRTLKRKLVPPAERVRQLRGWDLLDSLGYTMQHAVSPTGFDLFTAIAPDGSKLRTWLTMEVAVDDAKKHYRDGKPILTEEREQP
jgi:hypothetical protein